MDKNNQEPDKDKEQRQKKIRSLLRYYGIVMIVIILLNSFLFPKLLENQVQEVSYSEFLQMVEADKVSEVVRNDTDNEIVFEAKDSDGKTQYYKTGIFEDPDLREVLTQHNVKFGSQIPQKNSPLLNFLLSWILPLVIFYGFGQLLMRSISKRMGNGGAGGIGGMGNVMNFGKSGAKIVAEDETGVTFKDVAGEEEAKESLTEIVDFLHNPGKYAQIGARLPKGALLVGPPGTGKTLLAKAVAGEAHVPFFAMSGSEFVEMFVGMGASKVRDLFRQADEKAPCIVFIDEIDAIGQKRNSGNMGGNDEREQTLNQLLTEMDGFDAKKGVVILAATNRPESLDPALLRPGRFDRRIPVNLPDLNGREAILKVHAKDVHLSDDVDLRKIAKMTSGASGAELANMINEGALRAVRQGRASVNQSDLEESVEVVIAGYQRKNAVLSEKEKLIVSYHEIGHALVAAKQTNSAPVQKITIIPRTSGALGYTLQVEQSDKSLMSREELENKIATFTAGQAAEQLVFGSITTGASNDIEQATKLARGMVTRYGMGEFGMVALETVQNQYLGGDTSLSCSETTAARVDEAVIQVVRDARAKADRILKENEPKLHELAKFLYDKETITGEEFMEILNRKSA